MDSRPLPKLIKGAEALNMSFDGRVLYSSIHTPIKRAEEALTGSQTLYLVFSPLLFYGVETLLNRISSDSHILAIEQNPDIYKLSIPFFSPLSSRNIDYMQLREDSSPVPVIKKIGPYRFRRIVTVKLNGGYMLSRNFYNNFASGAESFLQSFWKNRMTTIHMGRLWCRNILLNLPALRCGAPLSCLHTTKPVIIAGAGESLEDCTPFISKYRDKFFVIAADTAVSTLLNAGIKADLLVILEAQHANLYDFYDPESLKIPAAFDLTSSPEIIRKHKGDKYFFISDFEDTRLLSSLSDMNLRPPRIPPLGSVGIAAAYIALCVSSMKVFHCGLDFSFIPDKYHSAGSPSHLLSLINENRTNKPGFFGSAYSSGRMTRADKGGRIVFTDLIMLSYADRLKELSSLSDRLIDIAEKGIDSTGVNLTDPDLILRLADESSAENQTAQPLQNYFKLEKTEFDSETERIIHFLNREFDKINQVTQSVIALLNSHTHDNNPELTPDLTAKIAAIDYTYLFFPDYPNLSADISFLKRLLFSASWFKDIIRKIMVNYGL